MSIQFERIRSDLATIASFTATPGKGASRPTFSPQWKQARDYVIDQAERAGCDVRIDAAGNVHARPKSLGWDSPAWLSGSHIDSVPHGGDFDGVVGVVVPLEILRSSPNAPLELMIFAEEEGTTFGLGMLGSRAWVGELDAEKLHALKNGAGMNYWDAGWQYGVEPDHMLSDRLRPEMYRGFIEVHIEQGPGMWKNGVPVAVVEAIAGRKQYRCTLSGVANHAGSTSMHDRFDALAGAANIMMQLEGIAHGLSPQTVITVGSINCKPNAINVIPDQVLFTIDFRGPENVLLDEGDRLIRETIEKVTHRRGLKFNLEPTESAPAVRMDAGIVAALRASGGSIPTTISGALHDSAILAPHLPTAMVFVASKDGISHNPAEFSRVEDIAAAAGIVEKVVCA